VDYEIVRPPVIILGMHRSGTSLLTRLLEGLGLFVGTDKDTNNEALFFQRLNMWMFRQAHAAWDHPTPFQQLLDHREIRTMVVDYLDRTLHSPKTLTYLGWSKFLRYSTPCHLNLPWGWKDPRNTFTLPLWLELFPDARVIHIQRRGAPVARSLFNRHQQTLKNAKLRYPLQATLAPFLPAPTHFTDTVRCADQDQGLALWAQYRDQAQAHVAQMGAHALTVQYENLVLSPIQELIRVADFCALPTTKHRINDVALQINREPLGRGVQSDLALFG